MRNIVRRTGIVMVMVCLIVAFMPMMNSGQAHAASIKLSKKTVYLAKGATYKLKVKGTKAKVKWKSSNKKIATVSKGKIKAKKVGKCTITAKVKGKTLKCKVIVETKAANKARKLRTYVLKKGKYDKGAKAYVLNQSFIKEEGTVSLELQAKKKTNTMLFIWTYDVVTPAEMKGAAIAIDLIKNSSVKKGTFDVFTEDLYTEGYPMNSYTGEITTKFDGEGSGITLKQAEIFDGSDTQTITDAAGLKPYRSVPTHIIKEACDDLNKILKKAGSGITMKSIGFTKL